LAVEKIRDRGTRWVITSAAAYASPFVDTHRPLPTKKKTKTIEANRTYKQNKPINYHRIVEI